MLLGHGSTKLGDNQRLFLVRLEVTRICDADVAVNGTDAENAIVNAKKWYAEEYVPHHKSRWDSIIGRATSNDGDCDCDDEDDCCCNKRESLYGDYNKPRVVSAQDFLGLRTGVSLDGVYINVPIVKAKPARKTKKK